MKLGNATQLGKLDTSSPEYQAKLRKVSEEFAAWYIYEIFKKMYNTIPKSGLIQESFGERWFREMLLQQYALKAARTDLKSVSDMVYKSLGGKQVKDQQVDRSESLKILNSLSSLGKLVPKKDEHGE
ncbi:rod-binding protein [Fervidobacterium thailandense]|uniref:rod-binding protein n=1 Tax=Fervidobacterium thailandense TaxID=1008305 RepID=UPI0008461C6B|nr:rod-binding protein [Fervidobacterium thailandense]